MSLHREIHFEDEICEQMTGRGWLFEPGVSAQYDRKRALFPEDVLAWVQTTQPAAWQALETSFGAKALDVLLDRLRDQMNARGTLSVLRHGIELHPVRGTLGMAQFKQLKLVLSPDEAAAVADGGEVSGEDVLAAEVNAAKGGITYIAFTATPKAKTMELFGRRPHPKEAAGPDNLPGPFDVYSMRQAIEEGFILDVLQNYITYKLAFRLQNGQGREMDESEVERSAAMKGIFRWVRLHSYNISQKVQVVVEHYLKNVQPLLDGHAKAMVVVGSRLEAVRWQLAMQKYIKARNYNIAALVAFSGEVTDKESGEDDFSETSAVLNPNLKGRDIRDAFDTDEYQVLLVANKFQTGFDQPLLCGMYVDRRLDGIQAVQTLSRLNRSYSGAYGVKDTTFVLDFVNDADEILKAFQTYYSTATLEDVTDPNLVYNIRAKLDATGYYDEPEVERVVRAELRVQGQRQSELVAAITPVVDRLLRRYKAARERKKLAELHGDQTAAEDAKEELEALELFKRDMVSFGRAYTFLSQIFDYGSSALEARAIFLKRLLPLLDFQREREGVDLSKIALTHHSLRNMGKRKLQLGGDDAPTLKPLAEAGSGAVQEREKVRLSEIIAKVNELFGGDTTDGDKLVYVNDVLKGKLLESEMLIQQAASNTKEQFAHSPDLDDALLGAIMDAMSANQSLTRQALDSEQVRSGLKSILLGPVMLYETLRANAAATV